MSGRSDASYRLFVVILAAALLGTAAVGLAAFEWWLRSDPIRVGPQVTLAQADFYPYLGIANLFPTNPEGVLQREYGYNKGDVLYQHRRVEQIEFAGDRFQRMFRLPPGQTLDTSAFRIFVLGSSVAHAGNVPLSETYFSKLQQELRAPYPIQVIAVGKGGASSTEELILFTLSILPNRPDMLVILNGSDFAMSSIMGVRPGDPFNASLMYSKHYDLFYNALRWAADRSRLAFWFYQHWIYRDLAANAEFIQSNHEYRAAKIDSLVSVYLHNVRTMIEICNGIGIPVVLAPQPTPDLLLKRHGDHIRTSDPTRFARIMERVESLPTSKFRSPSLIATAYEKLLHDISRSSDLAPHFLDVQEAVDLGHFVDFVHMDAAGQEKLAEALAAAIRLRLPPNWEPARRDIQSPPWP